MIFIILTILVTTLVILLFKIFAKYKVRAFRAIVINYFVCVLFGLMISDIEYSMFIDCWHSPWFYCGLLLGLCFICGFYAMSLAVKYSGVTISTVASKNSIILSATMAIFLFSESVSFLKVGGIMLAIVAIAFVAHRPGDAFAFVNKRKYYGYPALVLVMSAIIELVLKMVEEWYLPQAYFTGFYILIFGIAGLAGLAFLVVRNTWLQYRQVIKKGNHTATQTALFSRKDLLAGIALGIPNYTTIYLMMESLHLENWESSVIYPVINIGVVVLSSALAFIIFRDKLSRINIAGVIIAIIALLFIAQSSF